MFLSRHVLKVATRPLSSQTPFGALSWGNVMQQRYLSAGTEQQQQQQQQRQQQMAPNPPSELNADMARGVQDATKLLMDYGLGKRRLESISMDTHSPLLERWQAMMEAFLGTQVHVLAGLGYSPDEAGMALYNQQLGILMQTLNPETQEMIRIKGRDTWRGVLSSAFNIPLQEILENELSIVDARNVMHRVSQRMLDKEILDFIREKCSAVEGPEGDRDSMTPAEIQMRHHIVQDALIKKVYLGGEPTLVSECGFGEGERGYVFMQLVMSEHQADPLVSQYISTAMVEVLKAAGIDPATLQNMAQQE